MQQMKFRADDKMSSSWKRKAFHDGVSQDGLAYLDFVKLLSRSGQSYLSDGNESLTTVYYEPATSRNTPVVEVAR